MSGIFTTKEAPFPWYGYKSYRIEIDIRDQNRPLQRHIWTMEDGTIEEEKWIPTIGHPTAGQLIDEGWTVMDGTN